MPSPDDPIRLRHKKLPGLALGGVEGVGVAARVKKLEREEVVGAWLVIVGRHDAIGEATLAIDVCRAVNFASGGVDEAVVRHASAVLDGPEPVGPSTDCSEECGGRLVAPVAEETREPDTENCAVEPPVLIRGVGHRATGETSILW